VQDEERKRETFSEHEKPQKKPPEVVFHDEESDSDLPIGNGVVSDHRY